MNEYTTKEVLDELRSIAYHADEGSNNNYAEKKDLIDDLNTVVTDIDRLIDMIEYQKITQNLWKD